MKILIVALLAGVACVGVKPTEVDPQLDAAGAPPAVDAAPGTATDTALDYSGPRFIDGAVPEVIPPEQTVIIYAHTDSQLYAVHPDTLAVNLVGPFTLQLPGSTTRTPLTQVTDLAVDHGGVIIGMTYSQVLRIDGRTANCTILAPLQGNHRFNGLSWVNHLGVEILMATAGDGTVWRIDPATGASTSVGALGPGLTSSGDLVSVAKYGTLVTVKRQGSRGDDLLARMDPATGQATIIGPVGFNDVWGIGFWKDRVFGFNQTGQMILINPDTGAGTLANQMPDVGWWGAGVTTSVFVIP